MSDKLHDLIEKYFQILRALGKPANGLARAEMYVALKESGAEQVLEILDTIKQYEESLPNLYAAGCPSIGAGNTTFKTWTSDNTTDVRGYTSSSPYKFETTGGGITRAPNTETHHE